jgi:hypothetical protein
MCASFNTTTSRSRRNKAACRIFPRPRDADDRRHIINRKEMTMLRAILMAALLCTSQAALAQELTAAQRNACMGDYEKYCKDVTPGGGRIIACLAKSSDKLTPACKKVLADAEKK